MTDLLVEALRQQFPPFVGFPSIPRLFRDVVITEKIDGTNASVQVNEDGTVWAASRTRYITPESDNYGFAAWVKAHETELREGLGVGQHFGEWYGSGIQRGYGLTNGEKRFALFNTGRWWSAKNDVVIPVSEKMSPAPVCCEVVPAIANIPFDTASIYFLANGLREMGSSAVPGFMKPEGIVVFHTKSRQSYKYTFDQNDGHKTT